MREEAGSLRGLTADLGLSITCSGSRFIYHGHPVLFDPVHLFFFKKNSEGEPAEVIW